MREAKHLCHNQFTNPHLPSYRKLKLRKKFALKFFSYSKYLKSGDCNGICSKVFLFFDLRSSQVVREVGGRKNTVLMILQEYICHRFKIHLVIVQVNPAIFDQNYWNEKSRSHNNGGVNMRRLTRQCHRQILCCGLYNERLLGTHFFGRKLKDMYPKNE